MHRFVLILAFGMVALACAYLLATVHSLPDPVATNFGASGAAGGKMSRAGYRLFMLALMIGVPLAAIVAVAWLPGRASKRARIPHREYWFAPERRDQTLAFLRVQGGWFGCLLAAFFAGMHWIILQANAVAPARLPLGPFFAFMLLFTAAIIVLGVRMHLRFRRIPG
jgi:hypothetical protein